MEPASDTGGGAMDDSPAVLDGAPGGSEGGGESDGTGHPASLGAAAADGTAAVVVDNLAPTQHIVHEPFFLGLELLVALLQLPLVHVRAFLLGVAVAQVHLCHVSSSRAKRSHSPRAARHRA
eukprot:scaffold43699_cov80-Phaeocystis_antarctica.AAC.1